ncbi:BlaI/MecI/CopY family transcriptional regulator [Streptomyces sp. NBC_00878]|uniref:BlaI/MecI/CopY family transcriptional regulator n=1 Tax=Streptomyces sp. NBC_00878 TaxID=2975854 RepID=UPI002256F713|nr:BlaI/MecI/CopY family transcriptional regulator [Streptomyces sp. NBC_00878]MCX4902913.1 BlaI/MecI/CopY family transcriptional regulator [Streptomyces sp. NBC_00878]
MSEVESATTELKSQYAAQVAADLERNTKEQERIGAEVAALQEQLHALQHDQALLVNLRRTLDTESPAQAGPGEEEGVTAAPSLPRQASAETKSGRRRKATAAKPKKAAAENRDAKASPAAAKQPTLVELIHSHLGQQSEPRSSAEITASLTQDHPDRDIKPKVVRTTVEGLVAKGRVNRTKQGSAVFYTATGTPPEAATAAEQQDPATV